MKILIISAAAVLVIAAVFILLIKTGSAPLQRDEAIAKIQRLVEKAAAARKSSDGAIVLVRSEKSGIDEIFTAGTADGKPIREDQPFHIASVGKAFTATLIGILADRGALALDDPVNRYLDQKLLEGLFTVDGTDYSAGVTVEMLLSHTSGVADYFEDPAEGSEAVRKLALSEPNRFWKPEDLVLFTAEFQKPVGKPGEKYHYSDTGYILLGLIIEQASGMQFHEYLHDSVFRPLGMNDSYLMFYSEPVNPMRPIADIILDGVRMNEYRSLSVDWAGGGIISTAPDLARFLEAMDSGSLLSEAVRKRMFSFDYRFMRGIRYGMGFMEYRFSEFGPGLADLPLMRGHMGILGTQMFTSFPAGTEYISSLGSTGSPGGSVRLMIKILNIISRIEATS